MSNQPTKDALQAAKQDNRELRELDQLKSNFLSTISHELRSPLTTITGFVRLLVGGQAGPLQPNQQQMLERVLEKSERLSELISDLVEISEIDSGVAIDLRIESVDAESVLNWALKELEPRRESKQASIEVIGGGHVPAIQADAHRLGRILLHLIDNAIKFGGDVNEVKIEFETVEDEVTIHVRDSGIGIAPEKVQQIFDAFYQVDNELTRTYEGMGIGLTLVIRLVHGTGGRVAVDSELGKGTTVSLTYPRA